VTHQDRPRRTCLTVPGSSERYLARAASLAGRAGADVPDEVILDLEDAVAPAAKDQARALAARAVSATEWGGCTVAIRVNGALSAWAYRDVIEVVERSGPRLDAIVLPKVSRVEHVAWLDLLLGQVEQSCGQSPGRIAIEAQIEDAAGLAAVEDIARASPRLAALIFGPADFMADLGMRSLRIGAGPADYPGDPFHYPLLRILVAARAAGLQAIDGPYAAISDTGGLQAAATSAAALGFDGKWVVHPDQISVVNEAFTPDQQQYEHAELIVDTYARAASEQRLGAVLLGAEMIDAASHKLANRIVARGRAAGFRKPGGEHRS
jgi:citrate lyase subunit beta/citryl-CoA lyase